MAIIDMIKLKGQFFIAQDGELHDKIAIALSGRPLCKTADEVQSIIGDEWRGITRSAQYRKLRKACSSNTQYTIIYCAPVDKDFVLSEHGLSTETVQRFFNMFRTEEEESVSWIMNQPEIYMERTLRFFPNGVSEYIKDGSSGLSRFMLIPLHLWQELPLRLWGGGA